MPCFGFGLECPFVGKPHAVDFDGKFCTLCNFLGGFQKFLRRVASAHFANASLGFGVKPNLVGIPIALAFVLHFVDVDADVAFTFVSKRSENNETMGRLQESCKIY